MLEQGVECYEKVKVQAFQMHVQSSFKTIPNININDFTNTTPFTTLLLIAEKLRSIDKRPPYRNNKEETHATATRGDRRIRFHPGRLPGLGTGPLPQPADQAHPASGPRGGARHHRPDLSAPTGHDHTGKA